MRFVFIQFIGNALQGYRKKLVKFIPLKNTKHLTTATTVANNIFVAASVLPDVHTLPFQLFHNLTFPEHTNVYRGINFKVYTRHKINMFLVTKILLFFQQQYLFESYRFSKGHSLFVKILLLTMVGEYAIEFVHSNYKFQLRSHVPLPHPLASIQECIQKLMKI